MLKFLGGEKMIKSFEELLELAKKKGIKKIAVAAAQDKEVLLAVDKAFRLSLIHPILIGDKAEIEWISKENNIDISPFKLIHAENKIESCNIAVKLVQTGEASILMKGFVDTSIILKAVLNKEVELFDRNNLLSHVGVLKVQGYNKLFILSDSAMNIAPSLDEKVKMIHNALQIAHALENPCPKVALVCAVEKANKKMPATLDAAELVRMNEQGEITGCLIGGPFALDNAISLEAAQHKGIQHPTAGNADILITPDIEAGNILNKSMEYFGHADKAGIIMGAKIPIVLTSRASSVNSKLNSIALGILVSHTGGK